MALTHFPARLSLSLPRFPMVSVPRPGEGEEVSQPQGMEEGDICFSAEILCFALGPPGVGVGTAPGQDCPHCPFQRDSLSVPTPPENSPRKIIPFKHPFPASLLQRRSLTSLPKSPRKLHPFSPCCPMTGTFRAGGKQEWEPPPAQCCPPVSQAPSTTLPVRNWTWRPGSLVPALSASSCPAPTAPTTRHAACASATDRPRR